MTEHAVTSDRYRWLAAVRTTQARRERTRALRAELAAARSAGLVARQSAKLRRKLDVTSPKETTQ